MQIFKPGFLTLITVAGTCSAQVPAVAILFPDVPSLATLEGVVPGMSVAQLLELRKPSEAPYLGLREVINGDTVEYRVDHPTGRQSVAEDALFGPSTLNRKAIVYGINSWERSASPDTAERIWKTRLIALEGRTDGRVQCFATKRAGVSRTALARSGNVWLGVQLIERRTMRSLGGDVVSPAIVISFASTQLDPYVPPQFPRETMTCPQQVLGRL